MNQKYYQASGRASFAGMLTMIIGGLIVALVTSPVYIVIVQKIPSAYISAFATVGYGFLIGLAMSFLAEKGHLRSPKKIMTLSFLVGLMATCLQWVFFYAFMMNDATDGEVSIAAGYREALTNPQNIVELMRYLLENGHWSLGRNGGNVTGVALAFVWVVEAAIISIAPAYLARGQARKPYSETYQRWAVKTVLAGQAALIEKTKENKLALEAGDFSMLKPSADKAAFTRIQLWEVEEDDSCHYLTLITVKVVPAKKGKTEEKTTELVEYLQISPECAKELKERFATQIIAETSETSEEDGDAEEAAGDDSEAAEDAEESAGDQELAKQEK